MATHHSVSDWDMSGNWYVDSNTYVSSPSSIRLLARRGATCKRSEVWNVPQGMIISYFKASYDWGYGSSNFGFLFGFRNQATTGHGLNEYGYVEYGYTVGIDALTVSGYYLRDGSLALSTPLIAKPAHLNVWNKFRVTWWSDAGGGGLMIRLEYWDGSSWVKMVNDFNCAFDKYKNSTVNRVSIASHYTYDAWFDDTEIWGT